MTILDTLRQAAARISETGSDEASLEAEILLMHATGLGRAQIYSRLEDELPPEKAEAFAACVQRRLTHEPVPYITGHREFFGLEFEVTPAALIPRPESEMLVELVLLFAESRAAPLTIADIGTGSGAIAVSLSHALPTASVIATDISPEALDLARRNAERHCVANRIDFRCGDVLSPLDGPVDVIVTNLPYVRTDEWRALPPELAEHEPRVAFDGGPDGLTLIRRLLRDAPSRLRPGGALFAEISDDQAEEVLALVEQSFPEASAESRKDLANLDRILCVRLP